MRRTPRSLPTLCILGLLFLAACQPGPAATPTGTLAKPAAQSTNPVAAAVPSPAAAASPSPSPAAAPTASGPIEGIAGRVLTVVTAAGPRQVQVPESARIEQEGKGVPSDLLPGLSVGITGSPEGIAKSIRIFPAALGTPRPGQFPMSGAEQGNLMTNTVIQSFDGRTLVVTVGAATVPITVPPETEVLKPVPATFADLATGRRVLATGTAGPDGTLVAATVNLLGPPPPLAP